MDTRLDFSDLGRQLIDHWEGNRLQAYRDLVGVWTIGRGITAAAGLGIVPGPGMVITPAKSDALFNLALQRLADGLRPLIKVPVTRNQFSAIGSLAHNVGLPDVANSTLLRKVNRGDMVGAAQQFPLWCHAGGRVVQGLVDRRHDEVALFNMPDRKPNG